MDSDPFALSPSYLA